MEKRAVEVQLLLADRGQHRAPSIPGLLVAATAEIARLTVLAVDKDFDLIAEVIGQQMEELALGRAGRPGCMRDVWTPGPQHMSDIDPRGAPDLAGRRQQVHSHSP